MPTGRQLRAQKLRQKATALGITGAAIARQMDVHPTVVYTAFNQHASERQLERIEAAIDELARQKLGAKRAT